MVAKIKNKDNLRPSVFLCLYAEKNRKQIDIFLSKSYITENLYEKIFTFFPKTLFCVVYLPRITNIN
jgi:hypothetical protein